jgi:uncharacterized membrane protein
MDLIIRTSDFFFQLLPQRLHPPEGFMFPGSGLVYALITALVLGIMVRNMFGKIIMTGINRFIARIPVVSALYNLFREIAEAFLHGDSKKGFQKVVLVEWPRRDSWMIAFVTAKTDGNLAGKLSARDPGDYLNIFIPTTPNPTSGFFFMVKESDTIQLDMTVETAFRVIVSGGTLSPQEVAQKQSA